MMRDRQHHELWSMVPTAVVNGHLPVVRRSVCPVELPDEAARLDGITKLTSSSAAPNGGTLWSGVVVSKITLFCHWTLGFEADR